jgi:endonuclease-3
VEQYDGVVPSTRAELMKLPGVGQKTAGVVLLAAFGEAQFPVDTHVFRVSRRIGMADANTPEKVEVQLKQLLPEDIWSFGHHLLIWHGRRVCDARKPACDRCPLANGLCKMNMESDAL